MHHLKEEEFFFPYMYYFNIFTNALSNYDAILRTFHLPLVLTCIIATPVNNEFSLAYTSSSASPFRSEVYNALLIARCTQYSLQIRQFGAILV